MKAYSWIAGAMALAIAGCAHHHRPIAHPPATSPITTQPATLPATEPAPEPASPEILQRKTQSYTQSMQQLLNTQAEAHLPAPAPTPPPPTPAPRPATIPALPPAPQLEAIAPAPPPTVDVSINPPPMAATTQSSSGGALSSLTQRIDQQGHDQPHDTAAQLEWQLLAFLRDQPVPDENALSGLPSEDRDVLSAIMDGLSNYRDVLRSDPTATTTRKLQPLLDMADRIHASADLNVPVIALCSAVRGFGDYDVINTDNLSSAQSVRALVYCQVTNFSSQLNGQAWETHLNERITVYSEATGKAVWKKPEQKIIDRCHQRRHDCYCVELIDLPPELPAGKYVLTATLEDQISNKLTQATVRLTIK